MANKKEIGKKIALGMVGVFAVAALASSTMALVLGARNNGWFEKEPTKQEQPVEDENGTNSGEENDASLDAGNIVNHSRLSLVQTLNDEGIDPQAENSVTFRATVKDENGATPDSIQQVEWSMAWASGGTGNVSDYVTMATNGTSATFTLKAGFSTQIIVTAKSALDNSIKATATLDYYKRFQDITANLNGADKDIENGDTITVEFANYSDYNASTGEWHVKEYNLWKTTNFSSVGTIENTANTPTVVVEFSDAFKTTLSSMGFSVKSFTISGSGLGPAKSQYEILNNMTGLANNETQFANWMTLMNALSEAQNEIVVTMTIPCTYGGTQTVVYTLNVETEAVAIGGIEIDQSGFIF